MKIDLTKDVDPEVHDNTVSFTTDSFFEIIKKAEKSDKLIVDVVPFFLFLNCIQYMKNQKATEEYLIEALKKHNNLDPVGGLCPDGTIIY